MSDTNGFGMAKKDESSGVGKKEKEPYFGLPSGEKDTPQLRTRWKNYVKKEGHTFDPGDKANNYKLQRDNSFYQFNHPKYDK